MIRTQKSPRVNGQNVDSHLEDNQLVDSLEPAGEVDSHKVAHTPAEVDMPAEADMPVEVDTQLREELADQCETSAGIEALP